MVRSDRKVAGSHRTRSARGWPTPASSSAKTRPEWLNGRALDIGDPAGVGAQVRGGEHASERTRVVLVVAQDDFRLRALVKPSLVAAQALTALTPRPLAATLLDTARTCTHVDARVA